MPRYIAIGNLTIDDVTLPDGHRMAQQCGGACLYAAVGMRLWNRDVGIVSVVGHQYPEHWLHTLSDAGFDLSGIRQAPFAAGMTARMVYATDGSRSSESSETRPANLDPEAFMAHEIELWHACSPVGADIPQQFLAAVGAHLAPMPLARQTDCLHTLLDDGVPICTVDLPWWPAAQRPGEFPAIELASATLASEFELAGFFGALPLRQAAECLAIVGAPVVVVKRGEHGSNVYTAATRNWTSIPIYRTHVIDTTGAGDGYCGGFLVGLDETGDPVQAALYGAVSASFIVEQFGALYALRFSRTDAEARLAFLREQLADHG